MKVSFRSLDNCCAAAAFLIGALAVALFLPSCTSQPVSPIPTIQMNPYGISEADLIGAELALSLTESEQRFLLELGALRTNPYGFTRQDVQHADSMRREAAVRRDLWLNLDTNIWAFYPPSQERTTEAKTYWQQEKSTVEIGGLPYWQNQRELAVVADHQQWVAFCDTMIGVQVLRLELIEAMLADLGADEDCLRRDCSEGTVRSRKANLSIQEIRYYSRLIDALELGIPLTLPDWSRLSDIVADSAQVAQGITYWAGQIDSIRREELPYWQGEIQRAQRAADRFWVHFTEHMADNLEARLDLVASTLTDLRADSALHIGSVPEDPESIVLRKRTLAEQRVAFYQDLVDVLLEGISLAIVIEGSAK